MPQQNDAIAGLDIRQDGAVLRLTLDRADRRNALTGDMVAGLVDALETAATGDAVRVVALGATGPDFCAGMDLTQANARRSEDKPRTGHLQRRMHYGPHRLIQTLYDLQLPVVAGVRGWAAGMGNMLALSADFVVASRTARFWVPFVKRGFSPDSGTTFLLPRLIGLPRANDMILRGRPVDAEQAAAWGMVTEVVDDDGLDDAVDELVAELAGAATVALGIAKSLVHRALEGDLRQALLNEQMAEEVSVRSDDFKEGMRAFAQHRDADYQGR